MNQALQDRIAVWTFVPEPLEIPVPPDDPTREQHRAARARAFLVDDDVGPELPRGHGRDEAGHTRSRDDEIGHL